MAVKFYIDLLEENGSYNRVPVNYVFRSGERLKFSFEVNREAFIYIINQPVSLEEDKTLDGPSPSQSFGEPRLLFPIYNAGADNNRLERNRRYQIPSRGIYVMDDHPGIERLHLVFSRIELDMGQYFHPKDGRIRGSVETTRLNWKLKEWANNNDTHLLSTRSIGHEFESYGISSNPASPTALPIDLAHYN